MASDRYVCIDIEMSRLTAKEKSLVPGLSSETIQIGAVMLDENYNVISKFQTYVKPRFSHVTEDIEELTGIKNSQLQHADDFVTALDKYTAWVGNPKIVTFCWDQVDYRQMWNELYTKARHRTDLQEYLVHFIDLQKSFCDLIKAKQNVGLEYALEIIDEEFKGKQHDALCDAYNTAAILHKLCCSEDLYVEFEFLNAKNNEKKEEKKEEEYTSSLASLLSPELQKLFGCVQTSEDDEETANSDAIDQQVPQGEEEEMTDEEIKALGNKTLICSRYGIPKLSLYNFCKQIKDTDCMKVDL